MTMVLMTFISFLLNIINIINAKHVKKKLIPPLRWWDCCMSEDEKKEIEKLWNNEMGGK